MDEEIGKWLLDISKYIITAYILSQMFGKDNDSWCHLLVQSYWLFYCLHWDII